MKLAVSQRAEQDLDEIEAYIGNDDPMAAVRFVQRLTNRFQQLGHSPKSGKKRTEWWPGIRSITEDNYVILYRILDEQTVEIARVLHGRRNIARLIVSQIKD